LPFGIIGGASLVSQTLLSSIQYPERCPRWSSGHRFDRLQLN